MLVDVIVEDRNSANSLDYLKCVIRGAFVKGFSKVILSEKGLCKRAYHAGNSVFCRDGNVLTRSERVRGFQ